MRMYLFMAAIIVAVTPLFSECYCIRIEYARTKSASYTTHTLSILCLSTYFALRLAAVFVYECNIGVPIDQRNYSSFVFIQTQL